MAIPWHTPSEDEAEAQPEGQAVAQEQQLEELMLDLYAALQQVLRRRSAQQRARNHRLPRRHGDIPGPRPQPIILMDSPLPDVVISAVEQLAPATPLVTVSAPSSPSRDVTFQFPECSAPVPSPRPRPRRRRLTSESSALEKERLDNSSASCASLNAAISERDWANVGTNLRNIADDFHAAKTKDAEVEKSRLPFIGSSLSNLSSADNSFLSLLIPAPLRETLWTTVALYLGWRLVSRLR